MSHEAREGVELMLYRIAQKTIHCAIMELKAIKRQEAGKTGPSLIEDLLASSDRGFPEPEKATVP